MKKVITYIILILVLLGCGSGLTYEEKITQYNKLVSSADSLSEVEDYNQIILTTTEAIKITDTLSQAFIQRAEANLSLNNLKDARKDFSKAIKIDGETSIAYKGRAIANLLNDKKKAFLKNINIYIKHHENDISAYSLRADYYVEDKDYESAISDYSFCIKDEPENSLFYLKRGNVYAINGQGALSISDYDNYVRLNPDKNNDEVFYKRGVLNMKVQNYQKAISDFSLISESFGKVEVFDLIADCFYNLKQYDEAIENYSAFLMENPDNYEVIDKRANSYLKNNSLKNADSDFKRSASLKWESKGFFYKYGWYILFIIVYFLISIILSKTINEEYDNKKISKSYIYFFFTGVFGGHYLYTNKQSTNNITRLSKVVRGHDLFTFSCLRYLIHSGLIFILFFLDSFYIRSFYNKPDLLLSGVSSSTYSLYLIYTILFLLLLDVFLLPYYVFSHNYNERLSINDIASKQQEIEITELESLMNKQNTEFKALES